MPCDMIRTALRAGYAAAIAAPLAACAASGPDLAALGGAAPVEHAAAYVPASETAETIDVITVDEESARLAATPPPSPDYAAGPSIQGQPLIGTAPVPAFGAGEPAPAYIDEGDPWEGVNRSVFHFNDTVDTYVLEPTARAYRHIFPGPVRISVRNALSNLESPITWANDLLQGEWGRAHTTFTRFVVNSTAGVAGFHDVAAEWGYVGHREDFDQTLALHGVRSGPYLVVPFLGPSTPRHVVGRVVDSFAHPLTWILASEPLEVLLVETAAEGVVDREEVLDILGQTKATSPDYYVAVRSFYRQSRISEITNGSLVGVGAASGASDIDLSEDLDIDF